MDDNPEIRRRIAMGKQDHVTTRNLFSESKLTSISRGMKKLNCLKGLDKKFARGMLRAQFVMIFGWKSNLANGDRNKENRLR